MFRVELFDYSLVAAPVGIVLAIAVAIRFRSGWSILAAVVALPIGGLVGRFSWEWFADKPPFVEFGSDFEGYDWVIGFACVGVLLGAILGSWFAAHRSGRLRGTAEARG
jgi:hypothetical protein